MRSTTILWATGALLLAATTTATAQQPQHAAPVNGPHQSTMARKSPATTSASPAPAPTASTPASIRIREAHPGLLAKATVKPEAAEQTALAGLTGAHIAHGMIENRAGQLVYVFEVREPSKPAREVTINAASGAVIPAPTHVAAKPKPKTKE
ncbi:MAG TPA: PepSY domain-containing protein [Gemmatimonadales bacterium]|nr:PepSY domain-containing protein [Gemmatimonadales bacterium]